MDFFNYYFSLCTPMRGMLGHMHAHTHLKDAVQEVRPARRARLQPCFLLGVACGEAFAAVACTDDRKMKEGDRNRHIITASSNSRQERRPSHLLMGSSPVRYSPPDRSPCSVIRAPRSKSPKYRVASWTRGPFKTMAIVPTTCIFHSIHPHKSALLCAPTCSLSTAQPTLDAPPTSHRSSRRWLS